MTYYLFQQWHISNYIELNLIESISELEFTEHELPESKVWIIDSY